MAQTGSTLLSGTQMYDFTNGDRAIEFFRAHETVLLCVYHPIAPHWVRFAPVYDNLSEKISSAGIKTASLDITNGDEVVELVRKLRIPRLPTLVLLNGSDSFKVYHGILREKEILEYLGRQKLPAVSDVDSASLKSLREGNSVVVAAFLDGTKDSVLKKQFATVAEELKDDFVFAITTDSAAIQAEGVLTPSVVVFKKAAEERTVLSGWESEQTLRDFVKKATIPGVVEFLPELYESFLAGPMKLFGYIFLPSLADTPAAHAAILPLARKHRSQIRFGTVIAPSNPRLIESMLVPSNQLPLFVLHNTATNLKYHLRSINPSDIAPFITQYHANTLNPVIKSSPIPSTQPLHPLIEVVGLSFKDIVLNTDKDVFVEYYDPDCAPCLTLVPQLQKFAEVVAGDERGGKLVTVVKMDLDANDAPDSDIRGFPTIKLYPAGRKGEPVVYDAEQGHSVEKWARFLRERGAHGVDLGLGV